MTNFAQKTTWLAIVLIIVIFAAGFFAYQWWQVKGEVAKKIEENESLIKQVDELQIEIDKLQKEIEELKVAEEEIITKPSGWKTYRNEEYGFEIDYPTVGWTEGSEVFSLKKQLSKEQEETEERRYRFYIVGEILHLYSTCYSFSWKKIMRNVSPWCLLEGVHTDFEEEITTNFGVKGYKGKGGGNMFGRIEGVYFPLPGEEELNGKKFYLVLLIYYDRDTHYTEEDIEVFNKIVSSFRYIEK